MPATSGERESGASRAAILITGASGFLGQHLIAALRRSHPEQRIVALVRSAPPRPGTGEPGAAGAAPVEWLEGSLEAPRPWLASPMLRDLAGIAHLGARVDHRRGGEPLAAVNVEPTSALVELAAQRRCRMLFVSSSGTVGCSASPDRAPVEGDPDCEARIRRWPYYWSKLCAEREAGERARALGAELIVLRPPVLLGPGDARFRSTAHVLRLLRRQLPFLVDGGFHFVDVRDVAAALVRALEPRPLRALYHLPGHHTSLRAFAEQIAALSGTPAPRWTLPYPVAWALARTASALGRAFGSRASAALPDPVLVEMAHCHWGLASRYSASDLGFRPRPAEETLADTLAWLREHHPALLARPPAALPGGPPDGEAAAGGTATVARQQSPQ